MAEGFGRKYPQGRISGDDDGQLIYGIAADKKNDVVIINYFKPITWIGMDFEACMQKIMALAKALSDLSGKVISVTIEDPEEIAKTESLGPVLQGTYHESGEEHDNETFTY